MAHQRIDMKRATFYHNVKGYCGYVCNVRNVSTELKDELVLYPSENFINYYLNGLFKAEKLVFVNPVEFLVVGHQEDV